ncbi:uncharacterized protein LOC123290578 [Chrysoperla carnea]|uniref:uncharacterized protein LOC123290578 n=1 Tax=Chrysoperla carnea TaxID=189513 RepID=UPI001D0877BF|nr:uncharacterized protein LOC123290578 [Chrysoperla carnea]
MAKLKWMIYILIAVGDLICTNILCNQSKINNQPKKLDRTIFGRRICQCNPIKPVITLPVHIPNQSNQLKPSRPPLNQNKPILPNLNTQRPIKLTKKPSVVNVITTKSPNASKSPQINQNKPSLPNSTPLPSINQTTKKPSVVHLEVVSPPEDDYDD